MKRIAAIFLLLPLLLFASLVQAVPSVDEVQTAVKAGHYAQAETMMREVVSAKSESAKAHYVLAEILAHNGKRDEALKETREARRIDPAIKFADPAKFARFEELLQQPRSAAGTGGAYTGPNTGTVAAPLAESRSTTAPAATRLNEERAAAAGGGMPSWLWLVGAAVLALVVWRFVSSRRTSSASAPMAAAGMGMTPGAGYPAAPVGGVPGQGYGPQYQQPGVAAGRGPGMMGVGLGVAGGVAAGMLAERMLHGGHDAPAQADAGTGAGATGLTPGVFDDGSGSVDALRDRPVDFGNGGGWDDGGGAADFGSDGGGDAGGGDDGGW